jgi:hypothetical protein
MKITTDNGKIFNVLFDNIEELQLMAGMIANSYSGGSQWRVAEKDYRNLFGINWERAHQIYSELSENINQIGITSPALFDKAEIAALKKITAHMLNKLDDGDFSTIIGVDKSNAEKIATQLGQAI